MKTTKLKTIAAGLALLIGPTAVQAHGEHANMTASHAMLHYAAVALPILIGAVTVCLLRRKRIPLKAK